MKMSDKSLERLLYLASPIGLLVVWQLLLMAGLGDRRFIPAPSDIAARFVQMLASGELLLHTAVTLWRIAAGYVIGAVPAVAIGLLMAMFRPVRLFFDPLIAALFPIPKVALLPLLLLAFGLGDASKIAVVAIAVFFPVIVNTYVGAANIDKIYWDVARNYGASQTVLQQHARKRSAISRLRCLAGDEHDGPVAADPAPQAGNLIHTDRVIFVRALSSGQMEALAVKMGINQYDI